MNEDQIKEKVKKVIATAARLSIDPAQIDDHDPIFGDGLGLDSIDALDIAVALENEFGVSMNGNKSVFSSISSIAKHIQNTLNINN